MNLEKKKTRERKEKKKLQQKHKHLIMMHRMSSLVSLCMRNTQRMTPSTRACVSAFVSRTTLSTKWCSSPRLRTMHTQHPADTQYSVKLATQYQQALHKTLSYTQAASFSSVSSSAVRQGRFDPSSASASQTKRSQGRRHPSSRQGHNQDHQPRRPMQRRRGAGSGGRRPRHAPSGLSEEGAKPDLSLLDCTDPIVVYVNSERELDRVGAMLAGILENGDTLALVGDLGVGKTSFARALLRSLTEMPALPVVSPTFMIDVVYEHANRRFHHMDLYRVPDTEQLKLLKVEESLANDVCIVEWADRLGGIAPPYTIQLHMAELDLIQYPTSRRLTISLKCLNNIAPEAHPRRTAFNDARSKLSDMETRSRLDSKTPAHVQVRRTVGEMRNAPFPTKRPIGGAGRSNNK
jgi:tRNA threonylcarbamoyl adenosine modification protein YjeE